jgi:phosphoribosylaminoimidazole-succinocarboxamide synthase
MPNVPINLVDTSVSTYLKRMGYTRIHQGKVRDTYHIDKNHLLVVATDRISIFDFVLNALIPKKGEVLTALTHFWLMTRINAKNHLINSKITDAFNAAFDLREELFPDLPIERCLVVKNLKGELYPFEMILRHHIGGSVFKEYQKTGKAGGNNLPLGLAKWSKLETPIFTPSTKEEVGHDVNVDADYFFKIMKEKGLEKESKKVVDMIIKVYQEAYAFAEEKGILIIDTKMEVAGLTIVDEILTPDSSRFVFKEDYENAMAEGRDPQFLDKEPVRIWGRGIETPFVDPGGFEFIIGINNLDPENPEHVSFVHGLELPKEVIEKTTERYIDLVEKITGMSLDRYQDIMMGV